MSTAEQVQLAPVTVASDLTLGDLRAAIAAGWRDFAACPQFGLFFAAIYVLGGLSLAYALRNFGEVFWLLPMAAGFPLLAPFIATGLYEVSRRREAGLPVTWKAVLGSLRGRGGDDQLFMMGGIVFVAFSLWLGLAHGIFAIFSANMGPAADSLAMLATTPGIFMLLIGGAAGAVLALAMYAITVISVAMLVDRDVDFITAIIVSLGTVRSNGTVMLVWALTIAITLFLAMIPAFLGLFVVLPVLAHATWHIYRRAVSDR